MPLKDLLDKRSKLVVDARAALDEITKNTDEARAAELDKRHDTIMAEFDKTEVAIGREQKLADIEKALANADAAERAKKRPNPGDGAAAAQDEGEAQPGYRKVFYKFMSVGADLGELEPDERKILRGAAIKLKSGEFRAQTSSSTAGGYTVPTELEAQIVKSMKAWGPMYDEEITSVLNTSAGNPIKLPTVDDTSVTAGAHTEATALTDDGSKDVTFGQKSLDSYGFDTEFVRFSLELARDSIFNMESLLGDLLGERLGRIANLELTTGSGSGAPDGIVTAAGAGKTAAAVNAIVYDEIIDLVHSVDPAYRQSPKVRFMFNDLVLASLRKLKDGDGRYIWTAGDIQGGVPGSIAGYRYSVNQAMAGLSTGNKTMLFGDFGKYFVRKIGAPTIGVLRERFWPDLGIAGLIYLDGELADTAAVKYLVQA